MRKNYSKPLFFAETYTASDSIAVCDYKVEDTTVLEITKGDCMCEKNHNGHKYGGQQGSSGAIVPYGGGEVITLFNDGQGITGCQYDWGGRQNNEVKGYNQQGEYISMGTFAAAFYGNEATEGQHAPGYKGAAFFS